MSNAQITILCKKPEWKVARPFNRAASIEEMVEILRNFADHRQAFGRKAPAIRTEKLNSEDTVMIVHGKDGEKVAFYAFREMDWA